MNVQFEQIDKSCLQNAFNLDIDMFLALHCLCANLSAVVLYLARYNLKQADKTMHRYQGVVSGCSDLKHLIKQDIEEPVT